MYKAKNQYLVECNHCGNKGLANLKGNFDNIEEYVDEETKVRSLVSITTWLFLECPVCHNGIVITHEYYGQSDEEDDDSFIKLIYPLKSIDMKNTPKDIKQKFNAAVKNYNIDTDICMIALRKVLEMICEDQGLSEGNLVGKINDLSTKGIFPQELKDCGHLIRRIGNDGAHSEVNKISKWEIKDVISLVEFIIQYLYEIPTKISNLEKKYEKKDLK
jgi:hypothetical protein